MSEANDHLPFVGVQGQMTPGYELVHFVPVFSFIAVAVKPHNCDTL